MPLIKLTRVFDKLPIYCDTNRLHISALHPDEPNYPEDANALAIYGCAGDKSEFFVTDTVEEIRAQWRAEEAAVLNLAGLRLQGPQ